MTGLEHTAQRPSWDCRACRRPWPCGPARNRLRRETGGGTALTLAAWTYFEEYIRGHGPGPSKETYDRFLGWTRRPVVPDPRTGTTAG